MEQEFLREIIVRLESTGAVYAVTGSVASNLWGTPRTTHDVDIVVVLSATAIPGFIAAFAPPFYVSEPAVKDAVHRHFMFNVIDSGKGVKADFWVLGTDLFSESLLKRRRRVEIMPGQEAYVGSPEDVLLHKLVWNQITPSDRQLHDAGGIAAVQSGSLDLAYLRHWAASQGTTAVLEEVLEGKHLKQS